MNEEDFFNKIRKFIEDTYNIKTELVPNYLYKNNILIKTAKYDINISFCETEKDHFCYGKYKFVLFFNYEANKKYQSELNYHGGGYSVGYDDNNYSNIEKFLNHWFQKKKNRQMSIFDY